MKNVFCVCFCIIKINFIIRKFPLLHSFCNEKKETANIDDHLKRKSEAEVSSGRGGLGKLRSYTYHIEGLGGDTTITKEFESVKVQQLRPLEQFHL